jgi:hypothetical protein
MTRQESQRSRSERQLIHVCELGLGLDGRTSERQRGVDDHSRACGARAADPSDRLATDPLPQERTRHDERGTLVSASRPMLPAAEPVERERIVDRVTVALVPKAAVDLQIVHDRTGLSKTDIVNRAISLYEFVDAELAGGAELIVRRDGSDYFVKLL